MSCQFCHQHHSEPIDGFPIDKRTKKMLDLKVNKLDFGKNYRKMNHLLTNLGLKLNELDLLSKDPEFYISNYFLDLRLKVDSYREELKSEIDSQSEHIINKITQCEQECVKLAKQTDQTELTKELTESKYRLENIKQQLDSFEINQQMLAGVMKKGLRVKNSLQEAVNHWKMKLLNQKSYQFEVGIATQENILGSFICKDQIN